MTILMCAQKLTDASSIYRTEPKTKNQKNEKLKQKQKLTCSEETLPGKNHGVSPEGGGKEGISRILCSVKRVVKIRQATYINLLYSAVMQFLCRSGHR